MPQIENQEHGAQPQEVKIVIQPVKHKERVDWFTSEVRIETNDWDEICITDDSEWLW
ncbi:MAG: hypothetical protein RIR79_1208 [Pseudomonadota bacterium]|jgi:hypothetical protein